MAVGEALQLALDLSRFAYALAASQQPAQAAKLLGSSEALRASIGATFLPWAVRLIARTRAAIRDQLDEIVFEDAWQQGLKLTPSEAVALALGSAMS
ncbi:MAG: hypothetical protein E6I45_13055 [Chloroflexi bacterium]|nr:MAG: hypothetical protein E6I45_13055 [Chloroflexota bacterium]